jgi:type I restriction enzyme R subunit
MYDRVRARWEARLGEMRRELVEGMTGVSAFGRWEGTGPSPTTGETRRAFVERMVRFMEATDMAVVVSQAQNEEKEFAEKGLDIRPHRLRMVKEDLEEKFKDADDPFRMVFVTAMWMTGFDVPSLETIYLDKPLRNHTLMQAIARANRVFGGKSNGLIVDYVGIFRDLEKALAIYGSEAGGGVGEGDRPVRPKEELVAKLREGIETTVGFLQALGVEVEAILRAIGWERLRLLDDAREAILVNDATKARYLGMGNGVELLYRAVLPDPMAQEFAPVVTLFRMLTERIRILTPEVNIDGVMRQVEELLDASIATEGYVIREDAGANIVDLSAIDFEALRKAFARGRKHTEVERLRAAIERKLKQLVALNKTRMDYLERLQALIDAYNAGAMNVQLYFEELVAFAKGLDAEEQRAIANGLSEEELAVFDLLTKPGPRLTAREEEQVRTAARELLAALKHSKLVLDWRKKQTAKAQVQVTIQRMLAEGLPRAYSLVEMREKSEVVYQHVYDAYAGEGQGLYSRVVTGGQAY